MFDVAPTFLPSRMFYFIQHETFHAQSKIGSQPALFEVKAAKQLSFEKLQKESLRQILCFLWSLRKFQANVLINWFPVRGKKHIQSSRAFRGIITARGGDDRPTSLRKSSAA